MTERQLQLFNFIKDYITIHGFSPTNREMKIALNVSSNDTIDGHLKALERKGYLKREQKNGARNWTIIKFEQSKPFQLCPTCGQLTNKFPINIKESQNGTN